MNKEDIKPGVVYLVDASSEYGPGSVVIVGVLEEVRDNIVTTTSGDWYPNEFVRVATKDDLNPYRIQEIIYKSFGWAKWNKDSKLKCIQKLEQELEAMKQDYNRRAEMFAKIGLNVEPFDEL